MSLRLVQPFLLAVLRNPQFKLGQIDTEFGMELLRQEPVVAAGEISE